MPEMHESQAAPLRDAKGRWVPGSSGNPGGSPEKTVRLTTILRRILAETVDPASQVTRGELLMHAIIEHAAAGNAALCKEVLDRIDGKLAERVEYAAGQSWEVVLDPPEDAKEGEA